MIRYFSKKIVHFVYCQLNFIVLFPISYKILPYFVYYYNIFVRM